MARHRAALAAGEQINFSDRLYGAADVRDALDEFHHGKCAYCEIGISPVAKPNVEHFRPKGGCTDETTGRLVKPGYYWLAYDWTNLLLACPRCNGASNKANRFPLVVEAVRARSEADDLSLEEPLLLDPSIDEPRDHIRFRSGVAVPHAGSRRGRDIIDILDLNHPDLVRTREETIELVTALIAAVAVHPAGSAEFRQAGRLLTGFLSIKGEYLSCLTDAFDILI